jgi:hypothetical protein
MMWQASTFCSGNSGIISRGESFCLITIRSRGANKHQKADDGSLAIDYAKFNNALNAVERLA